MTPAGVIDEAVAQGLLEPVPGADDLFRPTREGFDLWVRDVFLPPGDEENERLFGAYTIWLVEKLGA